MAISYVVLFLATCWMAYRVYDAVTAPPRLPQDLPWVGRPKGLFSETRARLGSLGDFRWQISEVYDKVIWTTPASQRHKKTTELYDLVRQKRPQLYRAIRSGTVHSCRAHL